MEDLSPDASVRASDAEREAARERLADHMALGRITMDEYDQRSDAILNARTRAELELPFRDLPKPVPVVPPPPPVPVAQKAQRAMEGIAAVVGSMSVLIFFVLGFVFNAWGWAWLVFIVPGIIGGNAWEHRGRRGRRR